MLKDLQPQPLSPARHCPSPLLEPCANPSSTSGPSPSPPSPQMKSSGLASLRAQNKGQSLTFTTIQHCNGTGWRNSWNVCGVHPLWSQELSKPLVLQLPTFSTMAWPLSLKGLPFYSSRASSSTLNQGRRFQVSVHSETIS